MYPSFEIPPPEADRRILLCFLCPLCCGEELQGQRHTPVERRVSLEHINAHVLLHEAVQENREGSEADVVESQIGSIVQSLQEEAI